MTELQKMAQIGSDAVKQLRLQKLRKGHPFMINSRDLPSEQCYLEYPDGSITLVKISEDGRAFIPIRKLSMKEASALRHKYHLTPNA